MIEFKWDNPNAIVSRLTDELGKSGIALTRVPRQAIRRGAFELLAIAQRLAHKKTSTYVRSMTAVVNDSNPSAVEARIGSGMKYARYIEQGTGLFGPKKQVITIEAQHAGALFWGAFDKGKPVLRRTVNVKGMRPQAVFGRAVEVFMPRYRQIVLQEVRREK